MSETSKPKYMPESTEDPIRYIADDDVERSGVPNSGYYFYDECWCGLYGPFANVDDCLEALKRYAQQL